MSTTEEQKRRVTDKAGEATGPYNKCPFWDSHGSIIDLQEKLNAMAMQQQAIYDQNQTQLEMMEAWNNTKGFVKTTRIIGRILKWCAGIATALMGLYAFAKWVLRL